jgi:4-amino-4-deoxy-L-arabinose transferase-like glycosyltransferase
MLSVVRHRPSKSQWLEISGVTGLVLLSAALYLWALSRNGMGNAYYAAAVKSATVSWKAFLFGSLDPGSFITVDKPPFAFWVQALSARVFGFSSWSMLVPQALAGVATVAMVYLIVKRWLGRTAAFIAGLVMALTPIAVVIFRFNNPDAMLTFLLVAAAWAFWSALQKGSTWKLVICGSLVGLAFSTKMLEALVVLPAFVLVYLVFSRRRVLHRFLQIVAAGVAVVVGGGWWIALVYLWPAGSRPYIGGTSDNSALGLALSRTAGYLNSSTSGGPGGGPGGGVGGGGVGFGGVSGWLRMFNQQIGGQISWLLPLALLGLAAGICLYVRRGRKDLRLAGFLMWGLWTLAFVGVFSFAAGVLHPYYTVVLAPSIAALVGGGSVALWHLSSSRRWLAWLLPLGVAGSALWSCLLLRRVSSYSPNLGLVVAIAGLAVAVGLALVLARLIGGRMVRYALVSAAAACLLAGPSVYAYSSISRSVTGAFAAAGPASAGMDSGGMPSGGTPPSGALPQALSSSGSKNFTPPAGAPSAQYGNFTPPANFEMPAGGMGGATGGGNSVTVDSGLLKYLLAHQGTAKYLVAVQGAGFQKMLAAGEVHYVYVASNGDVGGAPGMAGSQSVMSWVTSHGKVVSSSQYGGKASGTLYYVG